MFVVLREISVVFSVVRSVSFFLSFFLPAKRKEYNGPTLRNLRGAGVFPQFDLNLSKVLK
jgi:hypothetical protein